MKKILVLAILLFGFFFVWAGLALSSAHVSLASAPVGPQLPAVPLPDLVLSQFSMTPTRPQVSQPVSFSIHIRNDGPGDAPGWRVNLYIDPADQPPTSTTPEIQTLPLFVTRPPGTEDLVEFAGYIFATTGCQHTVYAWADPRQGITETDETNNMRAIHLCVDQASADAYESDDTCSASVPIIATDGTPQVRSFAPINDVDYVRFAATQGMTYTVTAAGTGEDAEPSLEVADSCNFVPPFGTTTRLQFVAPAAGTYYLKLHNVRENPDTSKTTYELTVRAEGVPPAGSQPILTSIAPTVGLNDQGIPVVLTGTQFLFPTLAEMCLYQDSVCAANCVQMLDVTWLSDQKLTATVPPNLVPGSYCAQVTNPGGGNSRLTDAFTVLPSATRRVAPSQGYNDAPTELYIYGFNFANVVSLTVGMMELQNPRVINGSYLVATLPAGQAPGTYNLTVYYAGGTAEHLANAFTVLPSAQQNQDLYAQSNELWIDPVSPLADEPVSLGLVVHRVSGTVTLVNLPVRFAVNGVTLSPDAVIALMPVNGQVSTGRVYYTPTAPGLFTVTAVIDPGQTVVEASRINNTVTRTVAVASPGSDTQPPRVDRVTINGSAGQFVSAPQVLLSAMATDLPDPGGSGVADVRYIELEYVQGARLWVPVRDSDWLDYALNHINRAWTLTPVGGLHYIQAWARDGSGNISRYPAQEFVNYLPSIEHVDHNQVRVYRKRLALGEALTVTLTPVSGDPDLFVWRPDWEAGHQPWSSEQDGLAVEQVSFTAPVSGMYQIEVYGYVAADYQLTFATSVIAVNAGRLSPASPMGRHWTGIIPIIPVTSEPPRDVPISGWQVYLPLVLRNTN